MSATIGKKKKVQKKKSESVEDPNIKNVEVKVDSSSFFLEPKNEKSDTEDTYEDELVEDENSNNENSNNENSNNENSDNENSDNENLEENKEENVSSTPSEEENNSDVEQLGKSSDTKKFAEQNFGTTTETSNDEGNDSDVYSDASSSDEEIIDIRKNHLYQVFACLLEDEKGDNLVEVLSKISDNLERHNDNLEKLVEKVNSKNDDKICERFDYQNKILAKMARLLDSYVNPSKTK